MRCQTSTQGKQFHVVAAGGCFRVARVGKFVLPMKSVTDSKRKVQPELGYTGTHKVPDFC